jgi:hypothetical protein
MPVEPDSELADQSLHLARTRARGGRHQRRCPEDQTGEGARPICSIGDGGLVGVANGRPRPPAGGDRRRQGDPEACRMRMLAPARSLRRRPRPQSAVTIARVVGVETSPRNGRPRRRSGCSPIRQRVVPVAWTTAAAIVGAHTTRSVGDAGQSRDHRIDLRRPGDGEAQPPAPTPGRAPAARTTRPHRDEQGHGCHGQAGGDGRRASRSTHAGASAAPAAAMPNPVSQSGAPAQRVTSQYDGDGKATVSRAPSPTAQRPPARPALGAWDQRPDDACHAWHCAGSLLVGHPCCPVTAGRPARWVEAVPVASVAVGFVGAGGPRWTGDR